MKAFTNKLKSLWKDESAQGATEYILLAVVIVGALAAFGPGLKQKIIGIVDNLQNQMDAAAK